MKHIVIFSSNIEPISLEDIDSSSIEEYSTKISALLESNNVIILHTTSGSLIVRPNTISSIIVTNKEESKQEDKTKETVEEHEDIISD